MYSIGYDLACDEDETKYAHRLALSLGSEHKIVTLSSQDVPRLLEDVARLTEDPIQDPVTLPTLCLARLVAERTNIVLTGDGSDEIWGGYARFDHAPESLRDYVPRLAIFHPKELGLDEYPESYFHSVPEPPANLAPLDRIFRAELLNRLRNYHLARIDKLTMGGGLEARCPFLDIRVLNTGLRICRGAEAPERAPERSVDR